MSADLRPNESLAPFRLDFSPSYILVGVYRLSTDASIRVPVWEKCKHGFVRGALVGFAWVSATTTATSDHTTNWLYLFLPRRSSRSGFKRALSNSFCQSTTSARDPPSYSFPPPCKVRTLDRSIQPHLLWLYRPLRAHDMYASPPSIHHPVSHHPVHSPLSGCSGCRRRTSEHHPQLLPSEEYSNCQETSMGADRRFER